MWLETKYMSIVSSRLRNYKIKQNSPFIANFSCPYCGDSIKNKNKARGYVYTIKGRLSFKCHNCGKTASFHMFLKELDPDEYKKFIFETYKDSNTSVRKQVNEEVPEPVNEVPKPQEQYLGEKLSTLSSSHPAISYVVGRKLPSDRLDQLFFVDDLHKLKKTFPDYEWERMPKDGRIIFPVKNRQGMLVGVSARAINKTKLRYVILKLRDEPMIFNVENVDISKPINVTEGAIDSFFLPNAVAADGADFKKIGNILPHSALVMVFDDEPRNKEIVEKMKQIADLGYKMVIWPEWIREYGKDINAMIMNGLTNEKIIDTINANTHKGLQLKLALAKWRK